MRTLLSAAFAVIALAFAAVVGLDCSAQRGPSPPAAESPNPREDRVVREKVQRDDPAVVDVVILGRRVAAPQVQCGPRDEVWQVEVERRSGNRRTHYVRITRRADGEMSHAYLHNEDGSEFTTAP
jgi:hypothetical protein